MQRVRSAKVTVDGAAVGEIGAGYLVLLGVAPDDGPQQVTWLANKLVGLRLFADDAGRMNLSVADVEGEVLVVSQFTLYGDCRKGRRPSFRSAAPPEHAEPTYEAFCEALRGLGIRRVQTGTFGAMMDVTLLNDGPVTLIVDTP